MGGACGAYGGEERYIQGFGGEESGRKKGEHLKEFGVDGN
jgi:hypothetical protein